MLLLQYNNYYYYVLLWCCFMFCIPLQLTILYTILYYIFGLYCFKTSNTLICTCYFLIVFFFFLDLIQWRCHQEPDTPASLTSYLRFVSEGVFVSRRVLADEKGSHRSELPQSHRPQRPTETRLRVRRGPSGLIHHRWKYVTSKLQVCPFTYGCMSRTWCKYLAVVLVCCRTSCSAPLLQGSAFWKWHFSLDSVPSRKQTKSRYEE